MIHFFRRDLTFFRDSLHCLQPSHCLSAIVSFPFLLGLVSGTCVGLFSDASSAFLSTLDYLFSRSETSSFFVSLFVSFRFILLAWFFSTSILGIFFLPLLSAFRAFCFGCCIAALIQSLTLSAFLTAVITFGFPMLLELPAFLLSVSDAFEISDKLLFDTRRFGFLEPPLLRHLLFIVFICLSDSAYCHFLMPSLLALIK